MIGAIYLHAGIPSDLASGGRPVREPSADQDLMGFLMKLDKIDIRILSELQKNGRISNIDLAELVHLSPSPCLMRVKKLQAEGYITGYSAQIDVSKLGEH